MFIYNTIFMILAPDRNIQTYLLTYLMRNDTHD